MAITYLDSLVNKRGCNLEDWFWYTNLRASSELSGLVTWLCYYVF